MGSSVRLRTPPAKAVPEVSVGEAVRSVVRRQELFARRQAEPVLSDEGLASSKACWFGVGISTDAVSADLPLDVMILVYAQEMVRRAVGWEHSFVLIADTNAISSGIPALDVRRVAARTRQRIDCVTEALAFPVTTIYASDIARSADRLLEDIEVDNPYLAQQMAQTEVMRRSGAGLKVGWTLSSSKHDETYFDTQYRNHFGDLGSFAYTIGGRTLVTKRPRACPYLCKQREERLLLAPDEKVKEKLEGAEPSAVRGMRRLLSKLARAHKNLTGVSLAEPEAFAQYLVDTLKADSR